MTVIDHHGCCIGHVALMGHRPSNSSSASRRRVPQQRPFRPPFRRWRLLNLLQLPRNAVAVGKHGKIVRHGKGSSILFFLTRPCISDGSWWARFAQPVVTLMHDNGRQRWLWRLISVLSLFMTVTERPHFPITEIPVAGTERTPEAGAICGSSRIYWDEEDAVSWFRQACAVPL